MVQSTWERLRTFLAKYPPSTGPIALIILVVLAGNAMFVLGLANNDPISWTAGISHSICRVTCGRPMIDPNVGFITQSLGHQAAMDLLHLHFPWWNYHQGLGQPLVGEMQSAALFPLTLLFALPAGLVWFHVGLEVIAGISTYFLARRLSLPVFFATVAAMLFSLNGTYAWLGNAVLNPVAFIPMLLLGIEMIYDSASSRTNRGWYVAAVALALSLYSGFPEVAYVDGLFCLGWATVRWFSLAPEQRGRALRRLGLGGVIGIVLALPVLVPFDDFLKVAFVGIHSGSADATIHLPTSAIPMFFDPYVYGTIFSNANVNAVWGNIGGYFGASVCALAIVGLFGARLRSLRLFCALWTAAGLAGALNILNARLIWNLIPLVSSSSFPRYIMPSCEMAVIVLAALGLMDFATNHRSQRLFTTATAVMVVVVAWSALAARHLNHGVVISEKARVIFVGLDVLPFLALALFLVAGRFAPRRWAPWAVAVIVVGESLALFFVPTAESPKVINVDYAPIHFLQKNLGEDRFVDFAVLYPNWGTQFGINSLSAIDLPFPLTFKNFIEDHLYPGLDPGNQFVIKGGLIGVEAMEVQVANHLKAYESASAKYLLLPQSVVLNPRLVALGVKRVFHDDLANIYLLPEPRPFFSTANHACTVKGATVNTATVTCPAATTLVRTELSMKGWSATVNGRAAPITTVGGVFQQVSLPAGTSVVHYHFSPPHERYALILAFLGGLFLIGSLIDERRPFVPRRRP